MISAIEAVDGKMTMVAEIYVNACVVCGEGKRGAVGFRFLHSEALDTAAKRLGKTIVHGSFARIFECKESRRDVREQVYHKLIMV